MYFINRLRKNPAMLDGRNFTELLLHLCQLLLLSSGDVQAIQSAEKSEQAVCLLDMLEKANKHTDPDDLLSRFIKALLKANYKTLANYLLQEYRTVRSSHDIVDGGPSSNAHVRNEPYISPSTLTYNRELGSINEQLSYVHISSSKSKFVDKYRQLYEEVSQGTAAMDSKERETLTEKALTELHANRSVWDFVCKYTWLLKNVLMKASQYYNQAARAFQLLEMFGQALLRFPWKSELRKISTVSGVYKLRIAPYVTDAGAVLKDMGFEEQRDGSFLLIGSVNNTRAMEASYQCFLMEVRCRYLYDAEETTIVQDINGKPRRQNQQPTPSTKCRDSGYISEFTSHPHQAELRDSSYATRRSSTTSSAYVSADSAVLELGSIRSKPLQATSLTEAHRTVDHSSVDMITKYMTGIPDEGLSMLLRLPPSSGSSVDTHKLPSAPLNRNR